MFDLSTLKALNKARVRELAAQRRSKAQRLATIISNSQSLALDNAGDRKRLVKRLEVVL